MVDPKDINTVINGGGVKRQSIGKSYTSASGFLRPPKVMTDEMREEITRIESEIDQVLRTQPGRYRPDPEYLEIGKILNPDLRRDFLDRISKVYGLKGAVNDQGVGYVVNSGSRPYYLDRLDPSKPVDEVGVWFEQTIKQFYPEEMGSNLATSEAIRPSGRMPRLATQQRIARQINERMVPESIAILDIETTGLDPMKNEIWQIAARGSDDRKLNMYFDANMPGTTKGGPLSRTILEGVDPSEVRSLDDFGEVLDFLESYPAVGGQNVNFDLGFMINKFRETGRDDLADRLSAKYLTETGAYGDNVYDTLQLGRHFLQTDMAPELDLMVKNRLGRGSPSSLENILLESNLLELMVDPSRGHGYSVEDVYLELERRGLHDAFQDTMFEQVYHKELSNLVTGEDPALKAQRGFKLPGITKQENLDVRWKILESGAVTPYTKMGADQVDDTVMQALQNSRYADQYIRELDLGEVGVRKFVALSPIEHAMIQAREMGPRVVGQVESDAPSFLRALGAVKQFSQHVPAEGPFVMPDLAQYKGFMDTLAKANVPYANLSPLERVASMAMAGNYPEGISSQIGDTFGDVLLTSQMQGAKQAKVFKSKRLFLPMEMLQGAEEAGVFGADELRRTRLAEGEELFRLSPFEFTRKGSTHKDISANMLLSPVESEAEEEFLRLQKYIEKLSLDDAAAVKYGLGPEFMTAFRELNFESFNKYGIQVGSALRRPGQGGSNAIQVRKAYDTMVDLMGGGRVDFTDVNQIPLSVGLAQAPGEDGILRLGAVVTSKALEGEGLTNYIQNARMGSALADDLTERLPTDPALRTVVGSQKVQEGVEKIAEWNAKMSSIYKGNKVAIRGAVAATAIAAGYYMYKRREEKRSYFTDPFAQQAIEEEGWYERYQQEMGGGMAAQYNSGGSRDPLATAGVVGTLDNQKIGHTRMGSDKNSHLFGAA